MSGRVFQGIIGTEDLYCSGYIPTRRAREKC